jgi:hypothetical protein
VIKETRVILVRMEPMVQRARLARRVNPALKVIGVIKESKVVVA